ncbi:MAG: hypothetical protein HY360_27315 [Verrucomicrobia bacterium]|nr:hypothetical protein [Verrucomicrobiota bacterium]
MKILRRGPATAGARELTRKVYHPTKKPSFEKDYGLNVYEQARRTLVTVRGFINYLTKYEMPVKK